MASGKSIGFLIAGIALILVGLCLIVFLWIPIDAVKVQYDTQLAACAVNPDPAGCVTALQQLYGGDVDLLWNIYLYGGFGCIGGAAILLIFALKNLIKGT